MSGKSETRNMALFCDFENVALGVRDAKYDAFDIQRVLEHLLLKGSIVVKKAYCDWDRYKEFKAAMHEAAFELIEIPHVRQSGKNSADIRMVVDALDLCYTKLHVDTFVIISGDSDFSPLVSKLRENNKVVIGVGVKNSTSDLLIANCDEFLFYDDLVRESSKRRRSRRKSVAKPVGKKSVVKSEGEKQQDALDLCYTKEHIDTFVVISGDSDFSPLVSKLRENAKVVIGVGVKNSTSDLLIANCDEFIFYDDLVAGRRQSRPSGKKSKAKKKAGTKKTARKQKSSVDKAQEGIDLVVDTAEALYSERGDRSRLWGSMIKQTLKRRRPQFNESYYGFSSFNDLLEEAQKRGQIELEMDERSGGYIVRRVSRTSA
jgi:uncharacterized protein (TIGR00288 family)